MALLPPCFLAHDDSVQCDGCSPEVIWGKLAEDERRLLLSLPAIWDARELFERLAGMQEAYAICEIAGDKRPHMRWEQTKLGSAVAEYGRTQAQAEADRDHAFKVILGERDNLSVPEIWEGLSAEARRWLLEGDPDPGIARHPAHELDSKGLIDHHMRATSLAGHVAEHGRAQ